MVSKTAVGWILDVSVADDNIIILIKLDDDKVIRIKQWLHERTFYILPKSYSAGQDLVQQLSRQDQLIKVAQMHPFPSESLIMPLLLSQQNLPLSFEIEMYSKLL